MSHNAYHGTTMGDHDSSGGDARHHDASGEAAPEERLPQGRTGREPVEDLASAGTGAFSRATSQIRAKRVVVYRVSPHPQYTTGMMWLPTRTDAWRECRRVKKEFNLRMKMYRVNLSMTRPELCALANTGTCRAQADEINRSGRLVREEEE